MSSGPSLLLQGVGIFEVMSIVFGDFDDSTAAVGFESKADRPIVLGSSSGSGHQFFRVYFIDVVGLAERFKYEWAESKLSKQDVLGSLRRVLPAQGVGFVCCLPHICKVYQFGPEQETNLFCQAYDPAAHFSVSASQLPTTCLSAGPPYGAVASGASARTWDTGRMWFPSGSDNRCR